MISSYSGPINRTASAAHLHHIVQNQIKMTSLTSSSRLAPVAIESASADVRPTLEAIQSKYGFLPNLMATFANAPVVLNGYLGLDGAFNQTSFTPRERQLILLTASVENECAYCVAAHSTIAKGMLKVEAETVAAIRSHTPLPDEKLNALVNLVREIVAGRGHPADATVEAFLAAGYTRQQLVEVLLGVALKTISNYLDHLSPVELDPAFTAEAQN